MSLNVKNYDLMRKGVTTKYFRLGVKTLNRIFENKYNNSYEYMGFYAIGKVFKLNFYYDKIRGYWVWDLYGKKDRSHRG